MKKTTLLLLAVLLFSGILVFYPILYITSAQELEVTIKDKERITDGSGENITSKFIVYTQEEVFENTDSWLFLKFNSTDFQNELKVDSSYVIKAAGWRIPFFSSYRNIVKIKSDKNISL